jgi:regulator of sirC expression with transglutaminase-like and TPR domain
MADLPSFAVLARRADARLDELALALAAEFGAVDAAAALATLDVVGGERAALLGDQLGFAGDREHYDDPDNSMLDRVLSRRRGLPILLSVVYVEVACRAGVALAGVGLPGHFVVGHFGATPPVLLDPFSGGAPVAGERPEKFVRPWSPHEIAMRMLNNLVGSFQRRGNIAAAIRAGELRLALPAEEGLREGLRTELRGMRARLN